MFLYVLRACARVAWREMLIKKIGKWIRKKKWRNDAEMKRKWNEMKNDSRHSPVSLFFWEYFLFDSSCFPSLSLSVSELRCWVCICWRQNERKFLAPVAPPALNPKTDRHVLCRELEIAMCNAHTGMFKMLGLNNSYGKWHFFHLWIIGIYIYILVLTMSMGCKVIFILKFY